MRLHELCPPDGARKKRKRVGRGHAAGQGKTAGRGTKGQGARSGGGVRLYFEGGQLPLVRRLPQMRGFHNPFRKEYVPVNLERLQAFPSDSEVTPEKLAEAGIIKPSTRLVKILGRGEIDRPLTVYAHAFSASAKSKIEAAGGKAEPLAFQWIRKVR